MMMDSNRGEELRRLHPISIVFFVLRTLKGLSSLLPLIPALLIWGPKLFGGEWSRFQVTFFAVCAAVAACIVVGVLHWRRFGYRVEAGAIYVRQGVFVKSESWLTKERVQSLDTKMTLYDRLFGLVRLQVETAGGEKSAVVLSSIPVEEAERIRHMLGLAGSGGTHGEPAAELAKTEPMPGGQTEADLPAGSATGTADLAAPYPIRRLTGKELLIHSTSSDRFGIILLLALSGFGKLWDAWLKETNVWEWVAQWFGVGAIVWTIVLVLVCGWVVAVAVTYVTDYGFQVRLHDGKLIVTKGLFERKEVTLLPSRIQAVQVTQHVLRRPFGLVSVRLVVVGSKGTQDKATVLFPLLREQEVEPFLRQFVPTVQAEQQWRRLERSARRPYIVWPALLTAAAAAIAIWFIPSVWAWFALLLPIGVACYGYMRWGLVGWSHREKQLSLRYGVLTHHRVFVPTRCIQWHRMTQTPFQQRRNLATFQLSVASGKIGKTWRLAHAPIEQVEQLYQHVIRRRTP